MGGEKASQTRAREVHTGFVEESQKTLDLVNQTLTLSVEASQRAANVIQQKAKDELAALDRDAKRLLADVPDDDDRALVADQVRRSKLTSLASKIAGFQINRFILPVDIPLTPNCQFVRGMQFHLDQQFDDAFESWDEVALSEGAPDHLRSLAWYWIGYERNNLAHFEKAELAFGSALDLASPSRRFELERIKLETRFFREDQPDPVIHALGRLRLEVEKDGGEAAAQSRAKILNTLGNVHHEAGNHARKQDRYADAYAHYETAYQIFTEITDREKWALFGRAEAMWWLGMRDEADTLFEGEVRDRAVSEYLTRAEPRTKVLARTAELVCCVRHPRLRKDVALYFDNVVEALGHVDERLTVYSQVQRRNVKKEIFALDLEMLRNQAADPPPALEAPHAGAPPA
jgi:tetratricopeptide (TPR) repeat protein